MKPCEECNGSGLVAVGPWGSRPLRVTCPLCEGRKVHRPDAFTSGKISNDLWPYVRTYNGADETRIDAPQASQNKARFENGFGEIVITVYRPRSEFDHHNPILVAFRDAEHAGATAQDVLDDFAGYQVEYPGAQVMAEASGDYTIEHVNHARRVLSKLATLTKEKN